MGDIEIRIRRSVQRADAYLKKENNLSLPVHPPKITYQYGEEGIKSDKEEKVKSTQPVRWDYSVSRGKKQGTSFIIFQLSFLLPKAKVNIDEIIRRKTKLSKENKSNDLYFL